MQNTKRITISIYDKTEERKKDFILTVPCLANVEKVKTLIVLIAEQQTEEESNWFSCYGNSAESLLECACIQYGWKWENAVSDIEITI